MVLKEKMPKYRISIVPRKKAVSIVPRIINKKAYYLTDDYAHFIDLRDKFAGKIKINNLSGLFDEVFQEIKRPFLELISELNKKNDSVEWWGGQIASRNTASTPLLLNITYLFCAKKILSRSHEDIIFIVNSQALSTCISNIAVKAGYQVVHYRSTTDKYLGIIKRWVYSVVQVLYYFWIVFYSRLAASKLLKPLPAKKSEGKKRVVIRSWITKGTFNKFGKFEDRNFGPLPAWLISKNYEVWTLPMFFNLSTKLKDLYALIRDQEYSFLIPYHYLRFSDYLKIVYSSYRLVAKRIENVVIKNIDVSAIFNDVLKSHGFDPSLLLLNLCSPMLKRLKEKEFEIDGFYYPCESNPPEKKFILSCRKHFPNSQIIGFQHTTFFPNQLAYHLGPDEKDYHPFPDKIVCSGPIYVEQYKEAGFPSEILAAGPNLRFGTVYVDKVSKRDHLVGKKKKLMLPLTFSHDLAFESFVKVKDALKELMDYKVYIRSHPLLLKKALIEFLDEIRMNNYEFADDGIIQEWFPRLTAVISTGASITILEAVAGGIPVIRVIPDNTFFYDPFYWPNYPLEPVNTSSEIRQQLLYIDEILDNDKDYFIKIGKKVLTQYFTKPTEENLKVFL